MLKPLRGQRTYLVGGLMLLAAAVLYLTGDLSAAEAAQRALEALGLLALRAGVGAGRAVPDADEVARALLDEVLNRVQLGAAEAAAPGLPRDPAGTPPPRLFRED
jgi:hypothetical protein